MKLLLVHPSGLMYAEVYLRLEPLGLECVAEAARRAGHAVRLLDLQIFAAGELAREVSDFSPDAVGFSLNYLANVPEVIELAKQVKAMAPGTFVFAGGHSASFIAEELLGHAQGALDAVVIGEGEQTIAAMLAALPRVEGLAGVATAGKTGPRATLTADLDQIRPARDLTRKRRRYFIGQMDPCASIEFSRGCPWDCAFCSAWTFYGRTYRKASPEVVAEELASIREPNVFVVDDVAFVDPQHGMALADAIEKRGIRKRYYMETRCDTLIRNQEVFDRWRKLGLVRMFLGLESLNAEQLDRFRKRLTPNQSFEALAVARRLGLDVAINLIADPAWGPEDFERARQWAVQVPEIVHLTVATPYPGTEWFYRNERELTTADYRLFDVQHAVMPTKLPLPEFYRELVDTQAIINRKFMGWRTAAAMARIISLQLLHGQTNFLRMLFKFSKVYNPQRQLADHGKPVQYAMRKPSEYPAALRGKELAVHRTKAEAVVKSSAYAD